MARSISSIASNSSSASYAKTNKFQDNLRTPSEALRLRPAPVDKRKRLAANARERKRMNLLNKAYDQLRRRLNDAENKSKYDVLVQAKEYIQALAKICADFDRANPDHPIVSAAAAAAAVEKKRQELEQPIEPVELKAAPESGQLTLPTVKLASSQQHTPPASLYPVQSPSSTGSDCCLSPMSLADSVASAISATSSHGSTGYHPFYQHQASELYPNEQAPLLPAAHRIKQEPTEGLAAEFRPLYSYYHSFFGAHPQATL